MEKVEKSSPTLSASFFHWPLIDRQDLSGSLIGRRRMTNRRLNRTDPGAFYTPPLNVCLRPEPGKQVFVRASDRATVAGVLTVRSRKPGRALFAWHMIVLGF